MPSDTMSAPMTGATLPDELAGALDRLGAEVVTIDRHRARGYVTANGPDGRLFARFTTDPADEPAFAHEAVVREIVGSGPGLRTPRVIDRGDRWMIEPWIDPAPPRGAAAVDRALEGAAELARLYLPPTPPSRHGLLRSAKWRRAYRMARSPLGVAEIRRARRLLADSGLPRVTTHGDFHAGNLLGGADGPWVVDWELSGHGPAGADLIRLWTTLDDDEDRERLFQGTVELIGAARRGELLALRYALLVQTLLGKLESPGVGGRGPGLDTLMSWLPEARREAGAAA